MKERDVGALGALANRVRERLHGDRTYFNVNMHINATNVCVADCHFCSFARLEEGMPGAYTMTVEEAVDKVAVASKRHDRDPHRQRPAPGPAVLLLRGALARDQARAAAAAHQGLHRRRDRLLRRALRHDHRPRCSSGSSRPGLGSLARRRRRDVRRARAPEDLRRQGRRRRLARDPSRGAQTGDALQLHDALRPHRDLRGARRSHGSAARAAGRDRRLPDVHPARVPPREQRARASCRGRPASTICACSPSRA